MYGINYISIPYFKYKSISKYELCNYLKNKIDKHFDYLNYTRYLENRSRKRESNSERSRSRSRESRSRDREKSRSRDREKK